ncbi:MAG: hypothetical protein WDM94_09355 [Bauldia sp.]
MKKKPSLDALVAAVAGEGEEYAFELLMKAGARLRFANGTNELRIAGVAGTATSGVERELARSWTRAARRRRGLIT